MMWSLGMCVSQATVSSTSMICLVVLENRNIFYLDVQVQITSNVIDIQIQYMKLLKWLRAPGQAQHRRVTSCVNCLFVIISAFNCPLSPPFFSQFRIILEAFRRMIPFILHCQCNGHAPNCFSGTSSLNFRKFTVGIFNSLCLFLRYFLFIYYSNSELFFIVYRFSVMLTIFSWC